MNQKVTTVSPAQLSVLGSKLLTAPETVGELGTVEQHAAFVNAYVQLLCDHFGGEIIQEATAATGTVNVCLNESSPDDGGIWSRVE